MHSLPSHLADAPTPSPSIQAARRPTGHPVKTQLSLAELDYLRLYIEITHLYPDLPERDAEIQALTAAGFDTAGKSPIQLRKLRYDVLQRIDHVCDVRSALEQAGMGIAAWIRLIARMAEQDNWKYRIVAAKYWGLALGLFAAQEQGQGAQIIIGARTSSPSGEQAQVQARLQWPGRALPQAS